MEQHHTTTSPTLNEMKEAVENHFSNPRSGVTCYFTGAQLTGTDEVTPISINSYDKYANKYTETKFILSSVFYEHIDEGTSIAWDNMKQMRRIVEEEQRTVNITELQSVEGRYPVYAGMPRFDDEKILKAYNNLTKPYDNAWAGFPENELARHYYYDRRNESAFILKSKIESIEWLASPEGQAVMNSIKK